MTARLSLYAAWAAVALAPLPFGSVEPVYVEIWCAVLGLSLLTADTAGVSPGRLRPLLPLAAGVSALLVAVALQSLPPGLLAQPSPVWAEASRLLTADLLGVEPPDAPARAVTATAAPPWRALGPTLLFVLTFTRAFLLGLDEREARRLLRVVAWAGMVSAIVTMVWFVVEPDQLLWREKKAYLSNLTGTFVNRNTAATYFGTCAVLWLGALIRAGRRQFPPGAGLREVAADLVHHRPSRAILLATLGLATTLVAVLATGSRAGTAFTVLALSLVLGLALGRGRRSLVLTTGVALLAGGVALELFGGTLAGRVAVRGLGDPSRVEIYLATIAMIADAPGLGVGLGSFQAALPPYRVGEASSIGVVDKTHSVPLELAAEIGLPAALAIAAASLAVVMLLGMAAWRRGRTLPILGFATAVLAALHACVDFSLQIPGYAVTCAAVVGAALAQAAQSPADGSGPGSVVGRDGA